MGWWLVQVHMEGLIVNDACKICKERFMCDRVLYECPRETPPTGGVDELSDEKKKEWARIYIKNKEYYSLPKELEAYV